MRETNDQGQNGFKPTVVYNRRSGTDLVCALILAAGPKNHPDNNKNNNRTYDAST